MNRTSHHNTELYHVNFMGMAVMREVITGNLLSIIVCAAVNSTVVECCDLVLRLEINHNEMDGVGREEGHGYYREERHYGRH